jgi:S-adenosylmethionine hydrolase
LPVITLISDRRSDDFFLGRLKGQILKACPSISIVDLAHDIGKHSVSKAAFILKNSFKHFPDNTVHLVGVDSESSETKAHLIAQLDSQFFIAADNGLFSLVFDNELDTVVQIAKSNRTQFKMPALFEFGRIACELINGSPINSFGEKTKNIKKLLAINPTFGNDYIIGNLIYTDSYSNAVTNITFELFSEISQGRKYRIYAGTSGYSINSLSVNYSDVEPGELLAMFNSLGLLEIAMNQGEISKLFSFTNDTKIRVEFYDSKNS